MQKVRTFAAEKTSAKLKNSKMKKLFTLMFATLLATTIQAQVRGDMDDDNKVTTNDIVILIEKYLDVQKAEKVDTTLFHAFDGYIIVSSAYFTNSYYGDAAKLAVYKTSKDEYIVTFSDPQWGDAIFHNVNVGGELSGEGTLTMDYRGKIGTYEATIGGPMTTPIITMPSVMGGTTITFHVGAAPAAYKAAGSWKGTNTVVVGGQFTYTADITYKITSNDDGTINIVVPEYQLPGTVMGDLTLGTYTIANIAYDKERNAFYRDYANDGLSMHLKAEKDGSATMDSDYTFENNDANILVKLTDEGIEVVNNFQPGRMPFPIACSFSGTK